MIRPIFAVLVLAGSAQASVLYGTSGFPATGNLLNINQANGQASQVGVGLGVGNVGDLTSNPITGQTWGVKIDTNQLVNIDPATGLATSLVNLNSPSGMTSLAFNNLTGKLYGNTSVSFGSQFESLWEIDPVTGNCVFVGRILFDDVFALGFANDGTLYGISAASNQLITVNTLNGNGALVAAVALAGLFDMAARPEDGVMFVSHAFNSDLYTMNLANGALNLVGPYNSANASNVVGLAFVPSPGALALLGLGGLVAGRRRR